MNRKILGMMGIARRSGSIAFGYEQLCQQMLKGRIALVIIAVETSERTKKKILSLCEDTGTRWIVYGNKDELSHAIGQVNKTVFGISNENMARQVLVYYKEADG